MYNIYIILNSHSQPTLYSYSNFIVLLSVQFHFGHCLRQSPRLFELKFSGYKLQVPVSEHSNEASISNA